MLVERGKTFILKPANNDARLFDKSDQEIEMTGWNIHDGFHDGEIVGSPDDFGPLHLYVPYVDSEFEIPFLPAVQMFGGQTST